MWNRDGVHFLHGYEYQPCCNCYERSAHGDKCVDVGGEGLLIWEVDWIRSLRTCVVEKGLLMTGISNVKGKVKVVRRDRSGCVLIFQN